MLKVRLFTLCALITASFFSAYLWAQADAIKQRQENYKKIGDSFKTIRDQVRGDRDLAAITQAATTINELAGKVHTWFPEGSGPEAGVETEALPVIWEKREEFSAAIEQLVAASDKMLAAAKGGDLADVGGNIRTLGGACRNCHDNFRLDDDQ